MAKLWNRASASYVGSVYTLLGEETRGPKQAAE
jgi:hypothetical protein